MSYISTDRLKTFYGQLKTVFAPKLTTTQQEAIDSGINSTKVSTYDGYATTISNKVDKDGSKVLSTNDYTTAEKNKLAGIATGAEVNVNADWNATSGDAQILNKPTHLSGDIASTEKGATNGVATLGSDGKIPSAQLPSYVDDVVEYATKDDFPTTGESGKIYVDISTNLTWRWSGSIYVVIGNSLTLGETSSTAYAGDKGKAATDAITTHTSDSSIHVTSTDKTTWSAKQEALSADQLAATNSGITSTKVSTYDGYATTIAGKQNSLTTTQLSAVNSGITSTKVTTYDGYAEQISKKQDTMTEATDEEIKAIFEED